MPRGMMQRRATRQFAGGAREKLRCMAIAQTDMFASSAIGARKATGGKADSLPLKRGPVQLKPANQIRITWRPAATAAQESKSTARQSVTHQIQNPVPVQWSSSVSSTSLPVSVAGRPLNRSVRPLNLELAETDQRFRSVLVSHSFEPLRVVEL
jgi:hypothetical protein